MHSETNVTCNSSDDAEFRSALHNERRLGMDETRFRTDVNRGKRGPDPAEV